MIDPFYFRLPEHNVPPNVEAQEMIEDETIRSSEIAFPDLSKLPELETFRYLGPEADAVYNELWNKVKSN